MSTLDKLITKVIKLNKNLRFDELAKVLRLLGYTQTQSGTGSSHYVFRKEGKMPITIVKAQPIDVAYIKMVRDALVEEGFGND